MPLPNAAGVGFKPKHFEAIRTIAPALGFFEVHAENYMGAGGLPHAQLAQLRADYALSMHGVGLSIGGADALNADHLVRPPLMRNLMRGDPGGHVEATRSVADPHKKVWPLGECDDTGS